MHKFTEDIMDWEFNLIIRKYMIQSNIITSTVMPSHGVQHYTKKQEQAIVLL